MDQQTNDVPNNVQKPNKMIVDVIEISRESNQILINDRQGNEDWVPIKAPAEIKWIKLGECDITMTGGAVTFARNTSAGPVAKKKPYTPQTPQTPPTSYTSKQYSQKAPLAYAAYATPKAYNHYTPASSYKSNGLKEDEPVESTRIGVTLSLIGLSWNEIWDYYNLLTRAGKWIVATNHVYLEDIKAFNVVYFIKELRNGDLSPYKDMQTSNITKIKKLIRDNPELLEQLDKMDFSKEYPLITPIPTASSSKPIPMETFREEDLL